LPAGEVLRVGKLRLLVKPPQAAGRRLRGKCFDSLSASLQDLLDHSGLAQLFEALLDGLEGLYYDLGQILFELAIP